MITLGTLAKNEKMIACFFSQQDAPKTTVICECSNINLFLIFPHDCGGPDNMSQFLQLLFLTQEEKGKKKFILFIKKPQNPNNKKTNPKDPQKTQNSDLNYFLCFVIIITIISCFSVFVYFFWLFKGIQVLYSTIVIKPSPKRCLTNLQRNVHIKISPDKLCCDVFPCCFNFQLFCIMFRELVSQG